MSDILLVLASLIGIIAVIFLLSYALKWTNRKFNITSSKNLKVIERISFAPDKMIAIISVCGKLMLIGVTGGRIEKICDIDGLSEEFFGQEQSKGSDFWIKLMEAVKNKRENK